MQRSPDAAPPAGYVTVGRFGAPHGVKGWLRVISFMDPPGNILEFRRFWLGGEGSEPREIELDEGRPQGKALVAHIKGCDDREQCRLYTGRDLLLPKEELPALEAGEYYWHELQGLRVLNLRDEDLGRVDHLMETGANDVLVVKATATSVDDRERLIPYVTGQMVRDVDLGAGLIRVDWDVDF